jgi:hypothetical protein
VTSGRHPLEECTILVGSCPDESEVLQEREHSLSGKLQIFEKKVQMLKWLGPEGDQLRIAFTKVFGSRYESFGSAALHIGGLSDGKKGVQWHVGYDPRDGTRFAGVNLEGMQYEGWPVARLIQRDLNAPTLVELVEGEADLADVCLQWRRDYWQKQARPEIVERYISPTPLVLSELTAERWREALTGAAACLNRNRAHPGRATQTVTLLSGKQVNGEVSPHLIFRLTSEGDGAWEEFFREVRTRMQRLHAWAQRTSTNPVSF